MIKGEEKIKKAIVEALCDDPDVDAAKISVRVDGSLVTLTGTVDSVKARQSAFDAASSIFETVEVKNFLVVNEKPKEDPRAHIS